MQTKDYLQYIVEKIHSAVFATVDSKHSKRLLNERRNKK